MAVKEADWVTKAGLRAVCLNVDDSYRCGYVQLFKGNPNFGLSYNDISAYAHGGITYSEQGEDSPEIWWVGFDCMHAGDGSMKYELNLILGGEVRSLGYVVNECENLAEQLL